MRNKMRPLQIYNFWGHHSENGIEKTSIVKIWKLVRNGFEHKNRFKKHTPMSNGPQRTNFSDAL